MFIQGSLLRKKLLRAVAFGQPLEIQLTIFAGETGSRNDLGMANNLSCHGCDTTMYHVIWHIPNTEFLYKSKDE